MMNESGDIDVRREIVARGAMSILISSRVCKTHTFPLISIGRLTRED